MQLEIKGIKNKKKIFILLFDLGCVAFSSFLSHFLILTIKNYAITQWVLDYRLLKFTLLMVLIYPLLLYIFGLYEIPTQLRKLYTLTYIIVVSFLSCAIFLLLSRVFDLPIYNIYIVPLFFIIVTLNLFIQRILLFKYIISPKRRRTDILFVGRDEISKHILNEIKNSDYNIVGLLSKENLAVGKYENGLKVISTGKNLGHLIKAKNIKIIVLALGEKVSLEVIKKIHKYNFLKSISIYRSDTFYEMLTRKFAIDQFLEMQETPFFDIQTFKSPIYKNVKKLIDFLGALSSLILLFPIFLIVAILVKITSNGPLFYLQERVGFQEKSFKLIKFRTMITDAEKENGPQWASRSDLRVTKVGKILRRTRLDELPQFINILKGEMSFVGPRAFRKYFVEKFEEKIPFYSLKFSVKPGLTGWAQVNHYYRNDVQTLQDNIERLQYDFYYIKNASLFLDLFIILKTLQTIMRRPGY